MSSLNETLIRAKKEFKRHTGAKNQAAPLPLEF